MPESLADRIRALRQARQWTLKELAERSGVSVGMLSEVERGGKNPTVRLAYDIAQAFGCSISALLEGPMGAALLEDPESGVRRESHSNPLLHGRLEVVIYSLEPGASTGVMAPNQPGTLECVVVLDGELELRLDGEPQRLAAGASLGHGVHATEYANPSADTGCRFLVLVDTSRC
jgi:transcriptional regulator with XRE-family HTH domain